MAQNKINILVTAQDKASGPLSGIKNALGGVATVAGGIVAANVISSVTNQIGSLASNALNSAKDMEQLEIAFTTMLGSADKAGALLQDITEAAKATPFELPELQNASKSLLAFGVEARDVVPTLTRLGDVSAGIGANVGDIAEIYGKARVQGRLFAEDINQLTGRGIPIIGELAKQFGVAESGVKKLVEDGKVGFPQLEKAFKSMTGEGGQFAGFMEAQSESLEGIQSNISDTISVLGTQIVQESGLFDTIKDGAKGFLDFLDQNKDNIKTFFKNLVTGFVELKRFAEPIISTLKGIGVSAFEGLQQVIEYLRPSVENLVNVFRENMLPIINDLIADFQEHLQPALAKVVEVLGQVIPPIVKGFIDGLGIVIKIIKFLWDTSRPIFDLLGSAIRAAFAVLEVVWKTVLEPVFNEIVKVIDKNIIPIFNEIKKVAEPIFQAIGRFIQDMVDDALLAAKKVERAANEVLGRQDEVNTLDRQIREIETRKQTRGNSNVAGPAFAKGGDFVTNGPMTITVGDNPGGRERVQVTPLSSPNVNGPQGRNVQVTNNFYNSTTNPQALASMLGFMIQTA